MASLVPCTACRRHVRRHETQCRFCGAERSAETDPRELALPRDVKRATLFALGLTLAGQACGAESNSVAIYGAPSVMGGGSGGGGANGGNGGSGAGGASTAGDGGGGTGQIQPVYGAPVISDAGSGGALPMSSDAGQDAATDSADSGSDAGN